MPRRPQIETVYDGELGAAGSLPAVAPSAPPRLSTEAPTVVPPDGVLVDARGFGAELAAPDEVGLTLAHAVTALREGATCVVVRVALGSDFLQQIAKIRALRLTWSRLQELTGTGTDARLVIWAGPDAATWTAYDPWVNLLRNTVGVFAAVVGGADHVTPIAWDAALGEPDADAVRLAENTFHVLVEEGHLAAVADPAAGSWAIESWTANIAADAWALLLRIEAAGGLAAFPVATLAEAERAERATRIVKRIDGIIGTSLYPNPAEERPLRTGVPIDRGPARALPFERLRARADAAPTRPSVFLAGLGPLAEHGTRLAWVKGLYEIAGIHVVGSPVDDPAALVSAWRASGASVAVLCGSDDHYRAAAESYVTALHGAGARVVLAGRPKDLALPVDAQVYAGMDVVAALDAELRAQGVV